MPTNCIFEICLDKILTNQATVINNCYEILIFQKYHFKQVIKFMKSIFLSEKGENLDQLISLSVNPSTSSMNLKSFTECFLFDNLPDCIRCLKPAFYNTRLQSLQQIQQRLIQYGSSSCNGYYGQFNLIQQNLDQYIGFQFQKLPTILETHFSYIHLSYYMQILSFILRLKHCEMMISGSWKLLNEFKKALFKKQRLSKRDRSTKYTLET